MTNQYQTPMDDETTNQTEGVKQQIAHKAGELKQQFTQTADRLAQEAPQRIEDLKQQISEVPNRIEDIRQQVEQAFQEEPLRTVQEEVTVAGSRVLEQVQSLIEAGNLRRVMLKDQNGRTLLEIPLTLGVAAGAAALVMAPFTATVATIAALVAQVRIVVERYETPVGSTGEPVVEFTPEEPNMTKSSRRKSSE